MDLHDDLSLPADESSFLPSVSFTSTSGSGVGNTHDCVSMSGILSSSEKIHIADDSYTPSASNFSSLESSQVKGNVSHFVTYGEKSLTPLSMHTLLCFPLQLPI